MEELVTKEDLKEISVELISDIREIVSKLLNEKEDDSSSKQWELVRVRKCVRFLTSPWTLQNLRIAKER